MSEEPRYLVRNRGVISLLLGIEELRLVVKNQLFGGAVVAASPSPYPSHRVGPYDACVLMGPSVCPRKLGYPCLYSDNLGLHHYEYIIEGHFRPSQYGGMVE